MATTSPVTHFELDPRARKQTGSMEVQFSATGALQWQITLNTMRRDSTLTHVFDACQFDRRAVVRTSQAMTSAGSI